MFAVRENTATKKFQKPNILRKNSKTVSKDKNDHDNMVTTTSSTKIEEPKLTHDRTQDQAHARPKLDNDTNVDRVNNNLKTSGTDNLWLGSNLTTSNNMETVPQSSFNVELFLNDCDSLMNNSQIDIDSGMACHIRHDWCLDFTNGSQGIIIGNLNGTDLIHSQEDNTSITMVPLSEISTTNKEINPPKSSISPETKLTVEYLARGTMNYKCDAPNCNKRFKSEQKLGKHKLTHSIENNGKTNKQTILECPVKKVNQEGVEVPCGRTFSTREELGEHLNSNHTSEDASYVCDVCGRAFFWATGLRSHARSHGDRAASLACAWPGCGRVFRQPCRLREHTRAHTGDKPYPCRFPGCSWSFRTASKLMRHARAHTDERRHACAACGRAFLRREHLRDHLARHQSKHRCHAHGCQRMFTNLGALVTHMKKVHREEAETVTATTVPEISPEETIVSSAGCAEAAGAGCARAARTHCTWPLRTHVQHTHAEYLQVELSEVEGSDNNIYTIRSDLFLHGNVLNNEDSEQMPAAAEESAIDPDLGLLDAHPTIDLMQEELMYTDAAVDESSFRVLLLSGENIV